MIVLEEQEKLLQVSNAFILKVVPYILPINVILSIHGRV
jgi:hypothetical protein